MQYLEWVSQILYLMICLLVMARRPPMGFTPQEPVYKLNFEGTELDGLEVKTKCCTIGDWNSLLRQSEVATAGADTAKGNEDLASFILGYVTEWNLEIPDGNVLPVSLESFNKLSTRHGGMFIQAWQRAMVDVPTNSPNASANGGTSAEQSLGLGSELPGLPSWNEPS